MSRIQTPATIEAAPQASQEMLEAVKKKLGLVPNLFRMISTSPAALEGHLKSKDIETVKQAGYDDEQILEIVLHVALNTWTNYINEIAQTEIDFPVVRPNSK
jgi:hypothetical protein